MKNSLSVSKIFAIIFLALSSISLAQTSAWGSYDVYTRKSSQYSLGYMTSTITLPDYHGGYLFTQQGILYTSEYSIANLGSILINSNNEVNFFLRGTFRVGAGIGSGTTDSVLSGFPSSDIKYYTATIDFFSMDIGFDYTYVLDNGDAIVPRFQIGLVDIGGTMSILDNGMFNNNAIGDVTAFGFSIKPSIYFDFGNSTLGIAFFSNPFNFLDYRIVPVGLFKNGDRGLTFHDSLIKRYAVQVTFSY